VIGGNATAASGVGGVYTGGATTNDPKLLEATLQHCSPLLQGSVVSQCEKRLDPSPFYQACKEDSFLTNGPGLGTSALEAYYRVCSLTAPAGTTVVLPTSVVTSVVQITYTGVPINAPIGTLRFNIQAMDAVGKKITKGGDVFAVSSTGPGTLSFTVLDTGKGVYTVTTAIRTPGLYTISVTDGNGYNNLINSPFTINAVQG